MEVSRLIDIVHHLVQPADHTLLLAYLNFTYDSFANNGESNLDLSYAIGLAYPLPIALYATGTPDNSASFNNILDAIDKSYCLYLGGDDPNYG